MPRTKESGSNGHLIAEQWLRPLTDDDEILPGEAVRLMLARAYLDLEAERDALREAALQVRIESQQGVYPDPYGSQGQAIVVGANAYFGLVSSLGEISQDEARTALENLE